MNPLASRKKLLVAESELNRAQLVQKWQTMADEVHALTRQARTFGLQASAAAVLVAGLASFRRKKSVPAAEKTSWLQTVLKGGGLVATIWQTFRSQGRKPEDK
jgi:hypothetical protein